MNWIDLKDLLLVMLVFVPLERLMANRPSQRIFRSGWLTDFAHLFASGIIIKLGVFMIVLLVLLAAERIVPSSWRATIASQPLWLQFPELLILADLGFYVAHRAFHTFPRLWRFHAVHHSIEEMDWLAARRVHPVDQILTKGLSVLPVFALGFSMPAIVLFVTLYHWQSLLIHSNVRIGFGPLRWILASPHFTTGTTRIARKRSTRILRGSLPVWISYSVPCICRAAGCRYAMAPMIPSRNPIWGRSVIRSCRSEGPGL